MPRRADGWDAWAADRGAAPGVAVAVLGGPGGWGRGVVNDVSAWRAIRSGTTRYRPASPVAGRVDCSIGWPLAFITEGMDCTSVATASLISSRSPSAREGCGARVGGSMSVGDGGIGRVVEAIVGAGAGSTSVGSTRAGSAGTDFVATGGAVTDSAATASEPLGSAVAESATVGCGTATVSGTVFATGVAGAGARAGAG